MRSTARRRWLPGDPAADRRHHGTLPSGAVDQNINGVSYFAYGGAYYRPIYSGSGVYYEVVANPG